MKAFYITIILLFIGCSTDKTRIKIEDKYQSVDSIINQSNINIVNSDSVNRESEKAVAKKVDQTVHKIDDLKEEVLVLKQEIEVSRMAVKTVYKIDTVYIETKKNFWGKEKTNTTIKSDSNITEVVDTLKNN